MSMRQPVFLALSRAFVLTLALALAGATQTIAQSAEFGRCLSRKGATFYGTSWCPHCRAQRRMLGRAMPYVRYVECSVGSDHSVQASACDKADIQGYPTWVFADGSRGGGDQSLESLAAKTGCKLDRSAPEDSERTDESGVRRREVGGALIIDIP
jgi:glutaredoxin